MVRIEKSECCKRDIVGHQQADDCDDLVHSSRLCGGKYNDDHKRVRHYLGPFGDVTDSNPVLSNIWYSRPIILDFIL